MSRKSRTTGKNTRTGDAMSATQRKVFAVIYWRIVLGDPPPTYRELRREIWGREGAGEWVVSCVTRLVRKGYLVRDSVKSRAIRLTELGRRSMPTVSIDLGTARALAETFTKRAR